MRIACVAVAVAAWLSAAPASAQTAGAPAPRFEVSAGGGLIGGADLGGRDALLRQPGDGSAGLPLFRTATRLTRTVGGELSAGWRAGRRVIVEGSLMLGRPELRASITDDAEGAPAITVAERVDQYVVEGRILVMLDEWRLGPRTTPFVGAGAGYLRQLHEGRTLIEEGHVLQFGGGLRHIAWQRPRGVVREAGVRLDLRLYRFAGGIAFDTEQTWRPAVSAGVVVAF